MRLPPVLGETALACEHVSARPAHECIRIDQLRSAGFPQDSSSCGVYARCRERLATRPERKLSLSPHVFFFQRLDHQTAGASEAPQWV